VEKGGAEQSQADEMHWLFWASITQQEITIDG
jgi:hypothetical protein